MEELNNIPNELLGGKRETVMGNDEVGMLHAIVESSKSKDPSTQVGAAIIDKDGNLISVGCNNNPAEWEDKNFPFGNEGDSEYTKYPYIIHAERNCLANYNGDKNKLQDATMYVTLFPCNECAKSIYLSGIKHLVYLDDRRIDDSYSKGARRIFDNTNITYEKFNPSNCQGMIASFIAGNEIELLPLENSEDVQRKRKRF